MRDPYRDSKPTFLPLALLLVAGCVHAPSAPEPASSRVAVRELADENLGYSVELPEELAFMPGNGHSNVFAHSRAGVTIRVFPEHFAAPPVESACWERLFTAHLPEDLPGRPATAAELPAAAERGFSISGNRKVFFAARPRDASCLLLVIDGPDGTASATASVALPSFRVFAPSEEIRRALLLDASIQLAKRGETEAAAARRDELVKSAPEDRRVRLQLARILAEKGDPASLEAAVGQLEHVVDVTPDVAFPQMRPDASNGLFAQSLMTLGLALLQLGRPAQAVPRLAEAAVRMPDDPLVLYNFACALSLTGDSDGAIAWLGDALSIDPALGEHARTDTDLDPLHARPEWARLLSAAAEAAKGAVPTDEEQER